MPDVSSKVTFDMSAINKLKKAQLTALAKTAEALHTRVVQAQVVPFDTGNLQNESFFVNDSELNEGLVALTHSAPYARRVYFHPEYNFQKHENYFAQGEWYEHWIAGGNEEDYAQKRFNAFYKKESGI